MNILCKFGLHKPDPNIYHVVRKRNGRHKWHTNYIVCLRCGKRLRSFGIQKVKVERNG